MCCRPLTHLEDSHENHGHTELLTIFVTFYYSALVLDNLLLMLLLVKIDEYINTFPRFIPKELLETSVAMKVTPLPLDLYQVTKPWVQDY